MDDDGGVAFMVVVGGARISVEPPEAARLKARLRGVFSLLISIEPKGGAVKFLRLKVLLPAMGRSKWPVEDVVALDEGGRLLPLTRDGIEWNKLELVVPSKKATYIVEVVPPEKPSPPVFPERERIARHPSGLEAAICMWPSGKASALSLRFDDSHPTHLTIAIPELRRRGLKGTFMICPGLPDYIEHRSQWEAVAKEGDQEFANHTLHHKGARDDSEAEREIGEVAKYIRFLFPKATLIALNLGGGTRWTTKKPMRYFLEKYGLFYIPGSLGMDDIYGRRVEALRRHLERHIERGLWCRVHFHSIGKGMASSLETFRGALKVVEEYREKLWVAGMAEAYKYWRERLASRLVLKEVGKGRYLVRVSCETDPRVYDLPLTVELRLPTGWKGVKVAAVKGKDSPRVQCLKRGGTLVARFDIPPNGGTFLVLPGDALL